MTVDLRALSAPIVAAPMAGGPSTTALVRAVAGAGGLGFLAGGYKTVDALAAEMDEVADLTTYGVNLFVPGPPAAPSAALAEYRDTLVAEAPADVTVPEPDFTDTDHWDDKIALLERRPVPLCSFTFGLASADTIARLRAVGTTTVATVTSADEARAAVATGVDALCVQGPDGGGHRGTHDAAQTPSTESLDALLASVRAVTDLPLVAAGGIAGPDDVARVLALGAVAAQLGTAFLLSPEAGTSATHRAALTDDRFTATDVTRAFSGRVARGLVNDFMRRHPDAPAAYPQVNQLVSPLRKYGAAQGDPNLVALWAGTGWRSIAAEPAAAVVRRMAPTP